MNDQSQSLPVKKDPIRVEFPDFHNKSAENFLVQFTERHSQPVNKTLRREAREAFIDSVDIVSKPNKNIKLYTLDVDHNIGLLYPISSITGFWTLKMLAKRHNIPRDKLLDASQKIHPIYLCHSEPAFFEKLAQETGCDALKATNPDNADILEDLHKMRICMNKRFVFQDVKPALDVIKNEGGMIAAATLAPMASVMHRFHLWFGADTAKLFDAIVVTEDREGLPATNPSACDAEKALVATMKEAGNLITVPADREKPDGYHLHVPMQHINKIVTAAGGVPITSEEVLHVGDSLGSDGGAARNLRDYTGTSAQFAWLTKGFVVDPMVIAMHKRISHPMDVLGAEVVHKALSKETYNRPNIAITQFSQLLREYNTVRACP